MSNPSSAREMLAELEAEQARDALAKMDADEMLASIEQNRMDLDAKIVHRKAQISAARAQVEREEAVAAATEQASSVASGVEALKARNLELAAGHEWFDGIFDFQWQGIQFGGVAERWLLADEPGLGKTRQATGWLDIVGARKVLIICEANIANQFAGEVMELAPHRTLFNLTGLTPKTRHAQLDLIGDMSSATVIVNYEIWRLDKDALAKLLAWQFDTLIVDEAHNIKSTKTANYRNVEMLVTMDNTCPKCKGPLKGLWDAEALRQHPPKKIAKPCERCGWLANTMGSPVASTGITYRNKLQEWLATRSVKNIAFLTGTPILNEPTDLYPLLHLMDPTIFKTAKQFRDSYLVQNVQGKYEWRGNAVDQLMPLMRGRYLKRTRAEAGIKSKQLDPRIIRCEIDAVRYPKQHGAIKQITEMAQLELESGQKMTVMHLIALITRKRQANVFPGGIKVVDKDEESPTFGQVIFDASEIEESVKLDVAEAEILERLGQGKRQAVFSQFKTALGPFEKRLAAKGVRVVRLDGDTSPALRDAIRLNFDRAKGEQPKWDVVLANYKTGGTGLNLSAVTATHILDEEWNPGKRDQAYGRSDRITQTEENEVLVYRIPGSIDTWMANIIRHKERQIAGFENARIDTEEMAASLLTLMKSGDVI